MRDGGSRGRRGGRLILVSMLALAVASLPTASLASEKAKETGTEGGLGAAAALSSLIYGPVKLVYATGGLIVGGFAWAFTAGDSEVAAKVFTRSIRGTYVITPRILRGEDELIFIGRDVSEPSTAPAASIASASSAADSSAPSTASSYEDEYDEMGW